DATPLRDRRGGGARQDDDDVDDRGGDRTRRTRSGGNNRWAIECVWQQRPSRARRIDGGGSRRKRPVVSEAFADDSSCDQYRSRASRKLRRVRRSPAGLRRLREQSALLRRRGG